jgi:hypothetical protein
MGFASSAVRLLSQWDSIDPQDGNRAKKRCVDHAVYDTTIG